MTVIIKQVPLTHFRQSLSFNGLVRFSCIAQLRTGVEGSANISIQINEWK